MRSYDRDEVAGGKLGWGRFRAGVKVEDDPAAQERPTSPTRTLQGLARSSTPDPWRVDRKILGRKEIEFPRALKQGGTTQRPTRDSLDGTTDSGTT